MKQYVVIRGFSVDSLEERVNIFLDKLENLDHYGVHGEIQMLGHSEFVQVLTMGSINHVN